MEKLLVRLMVIAAIAQLGMALKTPKDFEKAARVVSKVNWKPISVFPEEAKRLRFRIQRNLSP
jgi:hypothetical protein